MNADTFIVAGSALVVAVFAHASNAAHLHPRETPPPNRLEAFDVIDSPALAESWRNLEFQDAGEALLWIDEEGNVGASVHVEQIVYFDRTGKPIGAPSSERCRRSVEKSRGATAVVCFMNDSLARAAGLAEP